MKKEIIKKFQKKNYRIRIKKNKKEIKLKEKCFEIK